MSERAQRNQVDVVALHHIASVLRGFVGISAPAMKALADRIERALGTPMMQETRSAGMAAADQMFRGSPQHRHGFNAGVAWTLQQWPNLPMLYLNADFVEPDEATGSKT